MAVPAMISPEEHLYLLIKKASPEKKHECIQKFNKLLGFDTNFLSEAKNPAGIKCPNCASNQQTEVSNQQTDIVCFGHMKPGSDRQRYLCRLCKTTFNDHTQSVIHRSKKVEKWPVFIKALLDGLSIRNIAQVVGISPTTAQAWRKKVLTRIAERMSSCLSGIVECEEYSVNSSNKGQKKEDSRLPQRKELIIFCRSRYGDVYIVGWEDWNQSGLRNKPDIIWHTDTLGSALLSDLKTTPVANINKKLLHTQNVRQLIDRFSDRYARMRGVARKYLCLYLSWQRLLEEFNCFHTSERIKKLLQMCI